MAELTVAVVGLGVHAHSVVLPSLTMAGIGVSAVHDVKPENLASAAVAPGVYRASGVADLLDHGGFDAGVVLTPPGPAVEIVDEFVSRRIPVFVEKPVGHRAAEVRALAERARSADTAVQVGFNRRFAPAYRQVRTLVRKARQPVSLGLRLAVDAPGDLTDLLRDAAIHQLDLCAYLLGEAGDVTGCRVDDPDGPRFVSATVTGQRGVATLQLCGSGSWGHPTEHAWADLPDGCLEVTDVTRLTLARAGRAATGDDQAKKLPETGALTWQANPGNPRLLNNSLYLQGYLPQLQQFATALRLGAPVRPGLDQAADALDLAERLASLPAWEGSR